jgi:hypothetical protein
MGPFVAVVIIVLHTPGGYEVGVNVDKIVSMREDEDKGHISGHVRCLINTNDGKFVSVIESCEEVRSLMTGVGK